MQDKNYNYETKCRRCGTLSEWFFSSVEMFNYERFLFAMNDYTQSPRTHNCNVCNKETIQDLVAYSPKGGE